MDRSKGPKNVKGCEKGSCYSCGFFHEIYCDMKELTFDYFRDIISQFKIDLRDKQDLPSPLWCAGTQVKEAQQKLRESRLAREKKQADELKQRILDLNNTKQQEEKQNE